MSEPSFSAESQSIPRSPLMMRADDTGVLIVDVQERVISAIRRGPVITWNCRRLLDAAGVLSVRVAVSEQSPEKLGSTCDELRERFDEPAFPKTAFSCRPWGAKFHQWQQEGVVRVLVAGIETHVCIQQTALDLLAAGFHVYVPVDAVGSRHKIDHDIGLRRMEAQGVVLTTTEAAMFEWCETAGTDEFRAISALAKESPPRRPRRPRRSRDEEEE